MDNIKIGIVGCGNIADTHVTAIVENFKGARISVCDHLPRKAELLRRKYDFAAAYTLMEEMLKKETPSSVHILTPPELHFQHAMLCLETGSHVFVEKPLSFNIEEVKQLYDTAKKCNRILLCKSHSSPAAKYYRNDETFEYKSRRETPMC